MVTPETLTDVARRQTGCPTLTVTDWQTRPLYGGINETSGGIFHVWGTGQTPTGNQDWSVVLKLGRSGRGSDEPTHYNYWRREYLVFQSPDDLLPLPDDGLVAPRCYGSGENEDGYWLWLEHIVGDEPRPWPLARLGEMARHLGAYNGRFLTGRPLPHQPWLAKGLLRGYAEWSAASGARLAELPDSALRRRGWPAEQIEQIRVMNDQRETLLAWQDQLPRTLTHGDAHELNLLPRSRASGQLETVAIDWAYLSLAAIGEELVTLLRAPIREATSGYLADLETVVYTGYLDGLAAVGWNGDPRLVRLGFATGAALRYGTNTFPPFVRALTDETWRQYLESTWNMPLEAQLDNAVEIRAHCLRLGDEALALGRDLMEP
jgi:hypothetical protein